MINGLAEKLQQLRWKTGLSQKQVAYRLGISPAIVSAYETGTRTPSVEILLSLSYMYNCSTDFLLGRSQKNTDMIIDVEGLTDKQMQAITLLIDSIRCKQ